MGLYSMFALCFHICCVLSDACIHVFLCTIPIILHVVLLLCVHLERLKFCFFVFMAVQFFIGSVLSLHFMDTILLCSFNIYIMCHQTDKRVVLYLLECLLNFLFLFPQSQICAGEAGRGHTEGTAVQL